MTLEHRLALAFMEQHPAQAARTLERLPVHHRADVVRTAPAPCAAVLREMTPLAGADCLSAIEPRQAAIVLERLPADVAIPLLRRMPAAAAEAALGAAAADLQDGLRRVLRYPEGTAGALMDPRVLALADDITVAEARICVRRAPHGLLYYVYAVDRRQRLTGVLDIPELMRARSSEPLQAVMHPRVETIAAWTPAAAVPVHPGWLAFHAMPVVDDHGRLEGAIRYQTLRRIEQDARGAASGRPDAQTAAALGELFRVGLAGLVGAVASADAGAGSRLSSAPAGDER